MGKSCELKPGDGYTGSLEEPVYLYICLIFWFFFFFFDTKKVKV